MKTLTKAEEQVMQVLWKIQRGYLKDVLEHFEDPRPHSNTIATMLKILVEKGFVAVENHGRHNLYKPKVLKADYSRKAVQQFLKGYFDGSPVNLVSQFVSDNKLSLEELESLLNQIKNSRNPGQ